MQGVYFLANDSIFELTLAFLESFRRKNPCIALCCIPFNKELLRISSLQAIYNFTIYDDQDSLHRCDQIASSFICGGCGAFRKLVAWRGPFDRFLYIDVDTIVLQSFDFAFEYLDYYDYVAASSNDHHTKQWVWNSRSNFGIPGLTLTEIEFAANTGFIVSRRGGWWKIFTSATFVEKALEVKDYMELHCMEQPYINFCVISSGAKFTSLKSLKKKTGAPNISLEHWAGTKGGISKGFDFRFPKKPTVLFLHWAGLWQHGIFEHIIDFILRSLGLGRLRGPRRTMPYYYFWRKYHRAGMDRIYKATCRADL